MTKVSEFKTRSSQNWQELPGHFDVVNARRLFPASNLFGIPDLAPISDITLPPALVAYSQRVKNHSRAAGLGLHCFEDDHRLESFWRLPDQTITRVKPFKVALTPDFSLYRDWPIAIQLWNTYRSRWCGAWWQSQGVVVIPSVSWSNRLSYQFSFLGIPTGSIVAISTLCIRRDRAAQQLFREGVVALMEQVQPTTLIVYGEIQEWNNFLTTDLPCRVVSYPSRWQDLRREIGQQYAVFES